MLVLGPHDEAGPIVCRPRRVRALLARLLYATAGPVDPHRTAVYYPAPCRTLAQVRTAPL